MKILRYGLLILLVPYSGIKCYGEECRILSPEEQKLTGRKVICDKRLIPKIHKQKTLKVPSGQPVGSPPPPIKKKSENFSELLNILKTIFFGFTNTGTTKLSYVKNPAFSFEGCPPVNMIGMFVLVTMGITHRHEMTFNPTCDTQGMISLSRNGYSQSYIELRNVPLYNQVKFEMLVRLNNKEPKNVKIDFEYKDGKATGDQSPTISFYGKYRVYLITNASQQTVSFGEKRTEPGIVHMHLPSGDEEKFEYFLFAR